MTEKDIAAIGISALALIVAILSYVNTFRQRRLDNQRSLRSALTDVISGLVEVDWQRSELDREHPGSQEDAIVEMRRILNNKRSYLARHGEFLESQMSRFVTDVDLNSLARAFASAGDYEKARAYWARCVELSPTGLVRAMNQRGMARFLFGVGEFEAGRAAYQRSLREQVPDTDDARRIKADTYALWMKAERDYGFPRQVDQLRGDALDSARRIGSERARDEMISYIETLGGGTQAQQKLSVQAVAQQAVQPDRA